MKILLISPPWYRLQDASLVHYPSGPCFIAGALEQVGYDSIVWNADYDPNIKTVIGGTNVLDTNELTKKHNLYLKNLNDLSSPIWEEVRNYLTMFRPDIVGLSVYSATYKSSLNVARIAKEVDPSIITIFGGIHPTIATKDVALQPEVDYVVRGEGEVTIQELVKAIDVGEKEFSKIKGIAFRKNGEVIVNPERTHIDDLDILPFPARHKIYRKEDYPPTAFQGIYGSRGCPFHCIFCGSFNLWGHKVRSRSAESLIEEIEETRKRYKTRYFYICDDVFFIRRERALRFCELLLEKKLNILWSAQTRAEMVDGELLNMMKKSGGQHVAIGVETGDERIRELIRKGNTLDQMRRASKLIKKHGLTLVGFFMVGFPWESEDEIQRTIDFMKEIDPTIAFPYIVTPAPGTELSQIAHQMGLIDIESKLENFYHESPEMCLSEKIPEDKRRKIIDKTLAIFAEHNKRHFKKDIFRRPKFYYTLFHDFGMIKKPNFILKYIRESLSG